GGMNCIGCIPLFVVYQILIYFTIGRVLFCKMLFKLKCFPQIKILSGVRGTLSGAGNPRKTPFTSCARRLRRRERGGERSRLNSMQGPSARTMWYSLVRQVRSIAYTQQR